MPLLPRLLATSRVLVSALADAPAAEEDVDEETKKKNLRRFETIVPSGAEPPPEAELLVEEDSERVAATELRAAELNAKAAKLRALLEERVVVDDEGSRLQRAVQQQEEEDSLKFIEMLRAQDESFALELAETKAAVEESVVERMRLETLEALSRVEERYDELVDAHQEAMTAAVQASEAAAGAAAEAATATTEARCAAAHESAIGAEREGSRAEIGALRAEVEALGAVLSHDTFYKRTSHATHALSATAFTAVEYLSKKGSASATADSLRTLNHLAVKLDDELLVRATSPFAGETATAPHLLDFMTPSSLPLTLPLGNPNPSSPPPLNHPTGAGAEKSAKVATLAELSTRFKQVGEAGRTAALVPEGSGLWGFALATLASKLTLQAAEAGQTETSLTLSRAEACLEKGKLHDAVTEVRSLTGHPAVACAGWVRAAEERLHLELSLTVSTAEAAIAAAALA